MNIHKQHLNNLVCTGLALLALAASDANAVGSTPVTITNPVTAADIAKAQGIQRPYQTQGNCTIGAFNACKSSLSVPLNKKLTVESISVSCWLERGKQHINMLNIFTTVNNITYEFFPSLTDRIGEQSTENHLNTAQFSQLVHLYADAGTTVDFTLRTDFAFSGVANRHTPECTFTLTGQTVDVP